MLLCVGVFALFVFGASVLPIVPCTITTMAPPFEADTTFCSAVPLKYLKQTYVPVMLQGEVVWGPHSIVGANVVYYGVVNRHDHVLFGAIVFLHLLLVLLLAMLSTRFLTKWGNARAQ